ncbi:MAG: hypothetical protein Q8O95_01845 [bacterium]|nr:hypothetical protein [bacterium]
MTSSLELFIGHPIGSVRSLGWFGFAADPPTLAHRAVVDAVLGSGLVEKVIVFPSGRLDYKEFQCTDWQRAEMVELWKAAADYGDDVLVSRFDLIRDRAFYWYDLWRHLHQIAPKIEHFFVLGSKEYAEIERKWDRGVELMFNARFIVIPRSGYPLKSIQSKDYLLPLPPISGSSTQARKGERTLLDEQVRKYIVEHHLYSSHASLLSTA